MLLRHEGYEVRGVHRGAEVLQAIFHFAPDVVLLDIGMPQMTGYEDRQQARAAGFEHHVAKPYEPAALLRLIGQLSGRPDRSRPAPRAPER